MSKTEAEEDRRFQEQLREVSNPDWRQQLQMHYKILDVRGPVKGDAAHQLFNRVKGRKRRKP